jgi:predicted kinase
VPGRVILLCGLPGSGKTTTALRLAAGGRVVRMSPDEWMTQLGIDLFDELARGRVEQLQWALAQDIARAGGTVVIEWGVWGRAERDVVHDWCRANGIAVELRFLDETVDVLWERIRTRNMEPRAITRAELEQWATIIQRPDAAELARYDPPS